MVRWAWLIALTGCAQIFGIDETSRAPDAPAAFATLQLEHVSISRQVVRSTQDLSGSSVMAKYLVADDAEPTGLRALTATLTSTDTWVSPMAGPAPVLFESPDVPTPNLRIFDFPVERLKANVIVLERQVHDPAPPPPTVAFNVAVGAANTATDSYQLFTIGAWTNVGIPAPAVGATQLNNTATPITLTAANAPQRRLDKITIDDQIYVLRYNGSQLVGHLDGTPFNQSGNDVITGTLAATTLNLPLMITVNQAQVASRLATVRPAVGAPTMSWAVRASPALDYNFDNGPQLHAGTVLMADPPNITAMYGNPFSNFFKVVLTWSTAATRTFPLPGTMAVATLRAGMFQRAEPSPMLALNLPAGLPDRITANGTVLNIDNAMVVGAANKPVEVTFQNDASGGQNTMYNVELFELVPMMTTAVATKIVTVSSNKATVQIPRELFKDGSYYTLRAITFQGCYPAVATGDLTQQMLPCAQGFADSGVFQVTKP